jgi:hypothetical protein
VNIKMLRRGLHKPHRIRPYARRIDGSGRELAPIDFDWRLGEDEHGFYIDCASTGHRIPLGRDHIQEFCTDPAGKVHGVLILRSQITLVGRDARVEPFVPAGAPGEMIALSYSPSGFGIHPSPGSLAFGLLATLVLTAFAFGNSDVQRLQRRRSRRERRQR